MNERELENFEQELRKLKTAKPPAVFMARMAALKPAAAPQPTACPPPSRHLMLDWWWNRLLAPAAALFAIAVLCGRWFPPQDKLRTASPVPTQSLLDDEGVELERMLVSEFDAVAQMPGGAPVRFRCREWTDQIVVRDSANGFVLERSLPRFEIIPVRLETY